MIGTYLIVQIQQVCHLDLPHPQPLHLHNQGPIVLHQYFMVLFILTFLSSVLVLLYELELGLHVCLEVPEAIDYVGRELVSCVFDGTLGAVGVP